MRQQIPLKLFCYAVGLDGVMDSAVGVMTGLRAGLVGI